MTTIEITETIQDGVLKAVETTQRLTLEAFGAGVSSLDGLLPARPAMPFAPMITPEEAVGATFRFAESLLVSQKAFLTELVGLAESKSAKSPK